MLTRFTGTLKESFKTRIAKKTGWGQQEVWTEFIEALIDASLELTNKELEAKPIDPDPFLPQDPEYIDD